ncbi:hypothetical protein [Streptomyces noursei]|uniref:hypothetical protein n=1 Tax=Streptomyces noursei TaxID=1971 RepID=UPI0016721BBA|nr:hypothetical protein [Streptomyces noursei]MCZ1021173.1 hypothetical protein [Streptomyces noursei]GGX57525.1 hypothetical protein GCM10010341_91860 [Streptomyces noursei]
MIWWLRVHAMTASAASLMTCFLLAPLLGESSLPIPSFFSGNAAGVSVVLLLPVIPSCTLLYAMDRTPPHMEASAVRPLTRWWTTVLLTTTLLSLLTALGEWQLLDFPLALDMVRNLIGYLGAGLIIRRYGGHHYAPIAVMAIPLLCGLFGHGPGGRPYWWAWPLYDNDSRTALGAVIASALFCAGLLTFKTGCRRD